MPQYPNKNWSNFEHFRCLVTFIPQHAGTYVIDVTFNGEQVHGKLFISLFPSLFFQNVTSKQHCCVH